MRGAIAKAWPVALIAAIVLNAVFFLPWRYEQSDEIALHPIWEGVPKGVVYLMAGELHVEKRMAWPEFVFDVVATTVVLSVGYALVRRRARRRDSAAT